MKINLSNLKFENGIYYSATENSVSYPNSGHGECYGVEDESYWFLHRNKVIGSFISNFHKGKTFVDVGGGNGFVTQMAEKIVDEAWLIEPGNSGAQNAKRRSIKNIICAKIQDACIANQDIDSIGAFDVIEHIEDDRAFLNDLYCYLRPGGKLFLTVPALQSLWSDVDVYSGHFRRYKKDDLLALLDQSGFKAKRATYFFSFLALPIYILRVLGRSHISNSAKNDVNHEHKFENRLITIGINLAMKLELELLKRLNIPIGSSLIVVAEKPKL